MTDEQPAALPLAGETEPSLTFASHETLSAADRKLMVARLFALLAGFLLAAQLALPWVYLSGAAVFGLTLGTSSFRGHPESGVGFVVAGLIAVAGTVAASGSFITRPAKVTGPVGLVVSLITVAIVVPTSAVVAEQKLSPSDVFPSALIWAPAWCMVAALLLFAAAALTPPAEDSEGLDAALVSPAQPPELPAELPAEPPPELPEPAYYSPSSSGTGATAETS